MLVKRYVRCVSRSSKYNTARSAVSSCSAEEVRRDSCTSMSKSNCDIHTHIHTKKRSQKSHKCTLKCHKMREETMKYKIFKQKNKCSNSKRVNYNESLSSQIMNSNKMLNNTRSFILFSFIHAYLYGHLYYIN